MKPNLILSGSHNLGYEELAPFLESLRATGCTAKVHLFLAGVNEENRKKIESLGVTTEPFTYLHFRRRRPWMYLWPLWKKMLAKCDMQGKVDLARNLFFFVSLRHFLSYEYLANHRGQFQNVLMTDCRDVYFQRDPFAGEIEPGVHCYLEAKTQFVGTCKHTQKMITAAFGPEVTEEMKDLPVSCAGVVLGDEESILTYLRVMIEAISTIRWMTASNDQGVHNYLIFHKMIPNLHVHDNYSDLVYTAGCEWKENVKLNDRDEVVRPDGESYSVLHQYDRLPELTQKLLAKLRG